MQVKKFLSSVKKLISQHVFNKKWRCNWCGVEIFEEEYFCKECLNKLPLINKGYCAHCGRELKVGADYCLSCKNNMVYVDKARSVFAYKEPINKLIKDLKYYEKRYLVEIFAKYMSNIYFRNYFNADAIVYVPMLEEAEKKRGFNQSKLLAEELSKIVKVPLLNVLAKTKSTTRQAKLGREERLKNLKGTFSITDKKSVKGKTILIVDDVCTTGATSEVIGQLLKKNGACAVYLLTVASVSSKEKY